MTLARRQAAYIAAVILTGIAYIASGTQFNGAWVLMILIGITAITDTRTTEKRSHA
jgi:hypothetical protein